MAISYSDPFGGWNLSGGSGEGWNNFWDNLGGWWDGLNEVPITEVGGDTTEEDIINKGAYDDFGDLIGNLTGAGGPLSPDALKTLLGAGAWSSGYDPLSAYKKSGMPNIGQPQNDYNMDLSFLNEQFDGGNPFSQWTDMASGIAENYDPDAFYNSWMNKQGGLQDTVMGAQSDLYSGLMSQAGRASDRATEDVAGKFAGLGGLYSGAAMGAAGREVGNIYGDVNNRMNELAYNTYGNLAGNMMGQMNNAYQMAPQIGMQAAGMGMEGAGQKYATDAGLWDAMMGRQLQGAGMQADLWNTQQDRSLQAELAEAGLQADYLNNMTSAGLASEGLDWQGQSGYNNLFSSLFGNTMAQQGQYANPIIPQTTFMQGQSDWDKLLSGAGAVGDVGSWLLPLLFGGGGLG